MQPIDLIQSGLARAVQSSPVTPVARVAGLPEGETEENPSDRSTVRAEVQSVRSADAITGSSRRVTAMPEGDSTLLQSRTARRPVLSETERNRLATAAADLLAPTAAVTAPQRSALEAKPVPTAEAGAAGRPSRRDAAVPPYPPSQKAIAAGEAEAPRILMPPPPFTPEPPRTNVPTEPPRKSQDLGVGAGMSVRLPGVGAGSLVATESVEVRKLVQAPGDAPGDRAPRPEKATRPSRDGAAAKPALASSTDAKDREVGAGMSVRVPGVAAGSIVSLASVAVTNRLKSEEVRPSAQRATPAQSPEASPRSAARPSVADARDSGRTDGTSPEVNRGPSAPRGAGIASRSGSAEVAMKELREFRPAPRPTATSSDAASVQTATPPRPSRVNADSPAPVADNTSATPGSESPDTRGATSSAAAQTQQQAQSAMAAAFKRAASQGLGPQGAKASFGI